MAVPRLLGVAYIHGDASRPDTERTMTQRIPATEPDRAPAWSAWLLRVAGCGVLLAALVAVGGCGPVLSRSGAGPFEHASVGPSVLDIEGERSMDGFVVQAVTFESPMGGRVPAYLYRPSGPLAAGGSPALLMQHGMPGDRGSLERLAAAYARAGVFVLSISAPFNRTDVLSDRAAGLLPAPHFDAHDSTHVVQLVHEQRRALDMLQALPEVDPERIGFVGFSYGGWIGALLASVEPRLAAAVLMAPTGGLASLLRSHWENTGYLFVLTGRALEEEQRARWLRMMEPLEAERWLGRSRRTPVLIQAGLYDRAVLPPEAQRLFTEAAPPKKLLWYEAGHELGRTAFQEQAAFLAGAVGLDMDRFKAPASLF